MHPTLEHMARWLAHLSNAMTRDEDLQEARTSIMAEAVDLGASDQGDEAIELYRKLAK